MSSDTGIEKMFPISALYFRSLAWFKRLSPRTKLNSYLLKESSLASTIISIDDKFDELGPLKILEDNSAKRVYELTND